MNLSERHGVSAYALFRNALVPTVTARGYSLGYKRLLNHWSFDGVGETVPMLVDALQELTGLSDLRQMTLLSLSDVFVVHSEYWTQYSWCPHCLEDMLNNSSPFERFVAGGAFSPLVWKLKEYSVCIVHELPMVRTCPHCQETFVKRIWGHARTGCCSTCSKWLGMPVAKRDKDVSMELLARSVAAAECVEWSLRDGDARLSGDQLLLRIRKQFAGNSTKLLARCLEVNVGKLYRQKRLAIREVCILSAASGCSVYELLTGKTLSEAVVRRIRLYSENKANRSHRTAATQKRREIILNVLSNPRASPKKSISGRLFEVGATGPQARSIDSVSYDAQVRGVYKERPLGERIGEAIDSLILRRVWPTKHNVSAEAHIWLLSRSARDMFYAERDRRGIPRNEQSSLARAEWMEQAAKRMGENGCAAKAGGERG